LFFVFCAPPADCEPIDFLNSDLDVDGDVDLADLDLFQGVFSGGR
jgi:hypothetical protein